MTFARVRALIFVCVLFLTAGIVAIMALSRDSQTRANVVDSCPSGLVPADLRMPERKDTKINVFNGTRRVGLASKIGNELKNRGFAVQKMLTAPGNKLYDDVAVIRYGPKAVGAAQVMQAYFLGQAREEFNLKRTDATVDIVIGTQFQQLATTTEVNQSIAQLQEPDLPPGTCDAYRDR